MSVVLPLLEKREANVACRSPAAASPPVLEAVSICKRFGSLTVLKNASLRLDPGSFHALLGGNGAGKSTLVKCIMGCYRADAGAVLVDSREQRIEGPQDAHALGIGMIYQHFTLVPNMTVLENLLLARPDLPAVIDWTTERKRLQRLMDEMPFRIDLEAPAFALAAGEKQKVEILKQIFLQRRILILDEPTSVLTPAEADQMLGMLSDMTRARQLSVLIITHKFREVMAFADTVTVLRHGTVVERAALGSHTPQSLARLMMGNDEVTPPASRRTDETGSVRLEIDDLSVENDLGIMAVKGLSLSVRAGEILGIAGVSGNGQPMLVEALAGQRPPCGGTIRVHGAPYAATRAEMQRHNVHCLPEEPLCNACMPAMSLTENLALRLFDVRPFVRGRRFIDWKAIRRRTRELIAQYRISPPLPDVRVETLSGGNAQRLVLARELSGEVDILVAANPCYGLDFSAAGEIRAQIMDVRNRGAAVLLVSEDVDELFELSDRLAVMFEGRLVYESNTAEADRHLVGQYMAGHG
jgi:ABC-type uncharacterized transport system ATPase subunit